MIDADVMVTSRKLYTIYRKRTKKERTRLLKKYEKKRNHKFSKKIRNNVIRGDQSIKKVI